jgi:N,N'-diacetyllegionaminate synthase
MDSCAAHHIVSRTIRTEIIAEVANAHQGDPQRALDLARHAASAGADAVKFQVYFADELLSHSHPRYEHFRALEFETAFWPKAISAVHALGVKAYCDVFGPRAFQAVQDAGADGYKIHASDLGNVPLLRDVASHPGKMFLSVGGASLREIAEALHAIDPGRQREVVLLHGIQTYPTPSAEAGLARLTLLSTVFGSRCTVGYMDHTDGDSQLAWALPILATGLGATVLEKHITERRADKGLDYYSSFEPDEFARFVELVRECDEARGAQADVFTPAERKYREDVRKRWVAARALERGHVLAEGDVEMKRAPGEGNCPDLEQLIGKPLVRHIDADEIVGASDVRQRVAALVVARMTSARLASKALIDVGGTPALAHLFSRLRLATCVDQILLCTTSDTTDDVLAEAAGTWGITVYRGASENVLERMLGALDEYPADVALRITGDDILVDPSYLDAAVNHHLAVGAEYTSSKALPSGTEVEVFNVRALRDLYRVSRDSSGTEYLTAYVADHRDQFRCTELRVPTAHAKPYRLTLDNEADLEVIRRLLAHVASIGRPIDYSLDDIVEFMESHPELQQLNALTKPSKLPESVTTAVAWERLA